MSSTTAHEMKTWPDFAMNMYDHFAEHDAEVTYDFDNLEVSVPRSFGDDPEHALWKMNGSLSVHMQTREHKK